MCLNNKQNKPGSDWTRKKCADLWFSEDTNILTNSRHFTCVCSIWLYKIQHIWIVPSMGMAWYYKSKFGQKTLLYCLSMFEAPPNQFFCNKSCVNKKLQKVEQKLVFWITGTNGRTSYFIFIFSVDTLIQLP